MYDSDSGLSRLSHLQSHNSTRLPGIERMNYRKAELMGTEWSNLGRSLPDIPMKRFSPWAVFVGAFPGAIPPMLGAIAETGSFGLIPGVLFFVQFTWQFPHFWAIAWVAYDDYKVGGFSLLPSKSGKTKNSAFQIVAYSLALIPFSLLPWLLGWTGSISMIVATILGGIFFLYSYRLFLTCEDKDARKLMFASFFYLPIIQFVYVFDRIEIAIPNF